MAIKAIEAVYKYLSDEREKTACIDKLEVRGCVQSMLAYTDLGACPRRGNNHPQTSGRVPDEAHSLAGLLRQRREAGVARERPAAGAGSRDSSHERRDHTYQR